jgi:hypothetical protein
MKKYLILFLLTTPLKAVDIPINAQFFSDYLKNAESKKKDTSVEIDEVIKLVDNSIKIRMDEFIKLGQESKEVQERANALLAAKKESMAKIYEELMPLDARLRTLYPDMVIWFDKLKQYLEEKKK